MESDEAIVEAIVEGDFSPVIEAFHEHEMTPPAMLWSPDPNGHTVPELARIHRYWEDLGGLSAGIRPSTVDPEKLGAGLGYLMILEVEGDAPNVHYRYRLYGTGIAKRSGFDLTGKRTDEVPTHPLMGRFFAWCYSAVCTRREPLFTEHNAPPLVMVANWSRIILPVAEVRKNGANGGSVPDTEPGRVRRLMVGNVPGPWRRPRIDAALARRSGTNDAMTLSAD